MNVFRHDRLEFQKKIARYNELVDEAIEYGQNMLTDPERIKEYHDIVSFLKEHDLFLQGSDGQQDAVCRPAKAVLKVKTSFFKAHPIKFADLSKNHPPAVRAFLIMALQQVDARFMNNATWELNPILTDQISADVRDEPVRFQQAFEHHGCDRGQHSRIVETPLNQDIIMAVLLLDPFYAIEFYETGAFDDIGVFPTLFEFNEAKVLITEFIDEVMLIVLYMFSSSLIIFLHGFVADCCSETYNDRSFMLMTQTRILVHRTNCRRRHHQQHRNQT